MPAYDKRTRDAVNSVNNRAMNAKRPESTPVVCGIGWKPVVNYFFDKKRTRKMLRLVKRHGENVAHLEQLREEGDEQLQNRRFLT